MDISVMKTVPAPPNGTTVKRCEAGKTYGMPDEPAAVFPRDGWGEEARTGNGADEAADERRQVPDDEAPVEAKDLGTAPQNKALDGADENKRGSRRRSRQD